MNQRLIWREDAHREETLGYFELIQYFQEMGNTNKKASIIIVGLDNSGKTTLVNSLKPAFKQESNIAATVGSKVE